MGIARFNSIQGLLEASNDLLREAHARKKPVYLVVPSHSWGEERKLQLVDIAPTGVQVLTLVQLVEQLWELFGDGSMLVQGLQRSVLLRSLVVQTGLLPSAPSPGFVQQLSTFVQEAVWPGLQPSEPLSSSESSLMELVSLYEQKLQHVGLVEPAQAEFALLQASSCAAMSFVFECPDLHSAHTRRFIAGLESWASVQVLEQRLSIDPDTPLTHHELQDVQSRLFSGSGGVEAQGHVYVGEALGAHVEAGLLTQLVQIIQQRDGIGYGDIRLCLPHPSDSYPRLLEELADARMPFIAEFSLPLSRTGFGSAYIALEQIERAALDEDAFHAAVDFVSSPYSGVSPKDARALQMRWRERAHSDREARLLDIRNGFDQGNVQAKITQERLQPLAALLEASRSERVSLMFENAKQVRSDVDALMDDRQVADALLSYLEVCERFSCQPDLTEEANLPVSIVRSFGDRTDALTLISPRDIGPAQMRALVLARLDSAQYPMAAQGGPFDAVMRKLDINRADTLAQDQRIMLLNAVEQTQDCFAFERSTHNAAGEESCQSALFEELLAVYRTPREDELGLPVQEIPQALQPWTVSLSEADELFESLEEPGSLDSVTRGELDSELSLSRLLCDAKGRPEVFSPTALEDYYRCPYRWFTCRRVGYNGMDASFDAAAQGNLVHAVMERFYREFKRAGHERVTPENLPIALEMASAAFDAQVERDKARERRGLHLKTQADQLSCEDLRPCVLSLVERDATLLPGYTPTYFELELGSSTDGRLEYAGVPVRGKVDRIDVDGQGNAVIIDYKLSSLSQGYGFGQDEETPKRIQTDIYATLVQRHFDAQGIPLKVLGSVYRSYSTNLLRGVFDRSLDWGPDEEISAKHDALPHQDSEEGYDTYLERVESVMAARLEDLKMGDIEPRPISEDSCEYCKGSLFCPRKEA